MKYLYNNIILNYHALCRFGVLLALLVPLAVSAASQPDSAAAQADRQAAEAASRIRADFSAAMELIKSEEYDKAIKLLNKVIAQSPGSAVPYVNLALVYKKMENLKLAEENLKLAIKIEPENPVANNEYALLYRKTGRFAEARQIYEKLLEKYPNFMMAHKNLGILCDLYMQDSGCALKHYQIYSEFMPDDGAVKIWIADIQRRSNR
ncbi:MAG: tetratricopeptide repeat protein [Gallionella sp.]|nr:tetratricopeptide repeat protein [Gallionella sp.]